MGLNRAYIGSANASSAGFIDLGADSGPDWLRLSFIWYSAEINWEHHFIYSQYILCRRVNWDEVDGCRISTFSDTTKVHVMLCIFVVHVERYRCMPCCASSSSTVERRRCMPCCASSSSTVEWRRCMWCIYVFWWWMMKISRKVEEWILEVEDYLDLCHRHIISRSMIRGFRHSWILSL